MCATRLRPIKKRVRSTLNGEDSITMSVGAGLSEEMGASRPCSHGVVGYSMPQVQVPGGFRESGIKIVVSGCKEAARPRYSKRNKGDRP